MDYDYCCDDKWEKMQVKPERAQKPHEDGP